MHVCMYALCMHACMYVCMCLCARACVCLILNRPMYDINITRSL